MNKSVDESRKINFLRCRRCGNELEKEGWVSEWDSLNHTEGHYKSIRCECGKKSWLKVDFSGSGHDNLFDNVDLIESAVRKVREG